MPTTFSLHNGLTIAHSFRKGANVSLSLRFIAGSMYESTQEIGAAHFLEHVVFDGTKKYPSEHQLATFIDEKGAFRQGSTGKDTVEYKVKILKEEVDSAFEYISEVTLNPLLNDVDIEKEKKVIEQEINRNKSDPISFSTNLIYSEVFKRTSLESLVTGDIEQVKQINRQVILSYKDRLYSASNAVLSVVGDINEEEVRKLSEKYFGPMNTGEKTQMMLIPLTSPGSRIEVVPGLKQATLGLGWRGYSRETDEMYALMLISRVLSGGRSGRLFNELRTRRGLIYAANANCVSGRNYGLFTIKAGLSENNINESLHIIREEIKKVCNELIPQEELKKAYISIKSGLTFAFEDTLIEASNYSAAWCMGKIRSIEEEMEIYKRLVSTPEYIKKIAQQTFSTEPSIVVLSSKK